MDIVRDHGALAQRSGTISSVSYIPIVRAAMGGRAARQLVDLSCGGGSLLVQMCRENPELTGVGIDLAPAAIAEAETLAAREGVADRARFAVADAFDPSTWPAGCGSAEVVWNRRAAREVPRR